MGFVLPVFNITVGIWRHGNATSNPPDIVSIANLALGETHGTAGGQPAASSMGIGGMWLRLPACTDIRDDKAPAGRDTCEVPKGSSRFYTVCWVDDIGFGFANEHRFAVIQGFAPWPVPFPCGGGTPPPPTPPPPIFDAAISTGPIPANSLVQNMGYSPSYPTYVEVVWYNQVAVPTVNGVAPLAGSQQSVISGLQTARIATYYLPPMWAGVPVITIQLPGMATAVMSALVILGGFTPSLTPDGSSHGNGVGGQPTVVPIPNPFAPPLLTVLTTLICVTPPVGDTPASPYTFLGSHSDIVGGTTFKLEAAYELVGTVGFPHTFLENPGAGWLAWAGTITESPQ